MWPRDGRITIRGTIVSGAPPDADWRLRLVRRESRRQWARARALNGIRALAGRPRSPGIITVPASVDAKDFEVVIGLGAFARPEPPPRELWDLYLVPGNARGTALRLGRHLDDMPGKKNIVVFPKQWVEKPRRLSIRPYYTDADHLSIRCLHREGQQ